MANLLDIDAHGRVVPQGDAARSALADRAGRFVLLPSAADLLVARRIPATGAAAPRPRCVLAGDLSAFPIPDFIAFMQQARLSGLLNVSGEGAERALVFHEGEVRSARSSVAGERVGEVAVRLGFVTEAQVAEAAKLGRKIGRALVDLGYLAAKDLYRCLHEQVAGVFHALLLMRSGTFALVDEEGERPAAPLTVSTQSLLMDGMRRIDELSLFRERIPGPAAVLRRRDAGRTPSLRPTEAALLALVDGRRTVAEIATASHLGEFDATKVLFHLAEAGVVEAVAGAGGPATEAERVAAVVRGMNALLRAVTQAIPPAAQAAFLDAAQRYLWDAASPYAAVTRQVTISGEGSVDEAALGRALAALDGGALAALEASGSRARVALGALREALFFWLFLAGERVTGEADEALGRIVRKELGPLEALAAAAAP